MASAPTTLTFALLGLLAERPSSAYELARQIQTSVVRGVWPSATSHTYAQIKQLVELGFAQATEKATGARVRSVYRVTPAGRKALKQWQADEQARSLGIESERLLKFLFSGGDDAKLLAGIEREVFESFAAIGDTLERLTASGTPIHAQRRKGAVLNLMIDLRETYLAWAREQAAQVGGDEDDPGEYARVRKRIDKHLKNRAG